MKKKSYSIIAVLWYVAAIFFFAAAGIGKNSVYVALGALYICIGSLNLRLYYKHKNHNEEEDK
ncbi:hypothetical protein [Methanolobus sp.]|uniref:hypothetical protein n=1 Tax=Methanolobus sp. TaxID=1874737 RepID=UPI0025F06E42|nr:hypothetical protein [Methanolobus sp.]